MKKICQEKIKIISNNRIVKNYFKIVLDSYQIRNIAKPGQFVEIKVSDNFEPLLRRPFGIHNINGSNIEILYEVIGKGTQSLSCRKPGEYLDVIGPLGNGFDYNLPLTIYQLPLLVAGGMGVAPLVFLAQKLKKYQGVKVPKCQSIVLLGARTKQQVLCEKEFKDLGCSVKIATDDGSCGFKGKVTKLLRKQVSTIDYRPLIIYACGPKPLLKTIAGIAQKHNIPARVSLEAHMACGFGACLGCAVNTKEGYKRVCKEGPVFKAEEIVW